MTGYCLVEHVHGTIEPLRWSWLEMAIRILALFLSSVKRQGILDIRMDMNTRNESWHPLCGDTLNPAGTRKTCFSSTGIIKTVHLL